MNIKILHQELTHPIFVWIKPTCVELVQFTREIIGAENKGGVFNICEPFAMKRAAGVKTLAALRRYLDVRSAPLPRVHPLGGMMLAFRFGLLRSQSSRARGCQRTLSSVAPVASTHSKSLL